MLKNNVPRVPTDAELEDLITVETREDFGRKFTNEAWQYSKQRMKEHYIAVFEDYVLPYYNYRGKLMVVVAPDYGDWYRVFIWYKGNLRWLPQQTFPFDGRGVSYAKLIEE
jgi:hypothetical protein